MTTFFQLNKHKLKFSFIFSVILCSFFVALFLVIGYFNNQTPESTLLIKILVFGCIGFPIFMISIIVIGFLLRIKLNAPLFKKMESLKGDNISIEDYYAYEDTKWFYTDYAKKISIHNHYIIAYVDQLASKHLIFEYKFKFPEKLKTSNIKTLENHGIEINPYKASACKYYLKKDYKKIDIRQLRTELLAFVSKIEHLEKS